MYFKVIVLTLKGFSVLLKWRNENMNNQKYNNSILLDYFDFSTDSETLPETTVSQPDETVYTNSCTCFFLNPGYSCRPLKGNLHMKNEWKIQEEPEDYSRGDIARSCRVHQVQWGGY